MKLNGFSAKVRNFSKSKAIINIGSSTKGGFASKEPPFMKKSSGISKKLPWDPKKRSVSKNALPKRETSGKISFN